MYMLKTRRAAVRSKTEKEHQQLEDRVRQLEKDSKTQKFLENDRSEIEAAISKHKQQQKTGLQRVDQITEKITLISEDLEKQRDQLSSSNKTRQDLQYRQAKILFN